MNTDRRRRLAALASSRLAGTRRTLSSAVLAMLITTSSAAAAGAASTDSPLAPRLEGVGQSDRDYPGCNEASRDFLNQGLDLIYAFNHNEAIRAFQEAARLDPRCPFSHWGEALAKGPNINDPMPPERHAEAYEAWQRANEAWQAALAASPELANTVEGGLIQALGTRYAEDSQAERSPLDLAFAEAMERLAAKYPGDPDVRTLTAAAWMNTMPWNYWDAEGEVPQPKTEDVIDHLEATMDAHPRHTGAHHYYIHIVEASRNPDRGLASADVLGLLAPSAGHLVHMPSHIYIRTGRYLDAAEANEKAILADEDYVAQCRAQGIYPLAYYPHNIHFLWSATSFAGQSQKAVAAAEKVASKIPVEQAAGVGFMQNFLATPYYAWVRFGQWQKVLNSPEPAADLVHSRAMFHYARALAASATGDRRSAKRSLKELRRLARSKAASDLAVGFTTSGEIATMASEIVAAEIAWERGKLRKARAAFERAIAIEDTLRYSEPPQWHQPTRHRLGDLLYAQGENAAAARVFREDLDEFRDNGWALYGLVRALEAVTATGDAAAETAHELEDARSRLEKAWKAADIELATTSFR